MNKKEYLELFCVGKETAILDCLRKIDINQKGFLIVTEKDCPIAVLTDGDLRRLIINGASLKDNLEEFSSKDFKFLSEELNFFSIAEIFNSLSINFIPIICSEGKLIDIITKEQFEASVLLNQPLDHKKRLDERLIENLHHQIVPKPWGYYKTTLLTPDYQSKILCVYPLQSISLQSHNYREEHWINVKGNGEVVIDKSIKEFKSGDYVFIPKGSRHRLINKSETENLIINEVQLGTNFDEDDIVRYEDNYGR